MNIAVVLAVILAIPIMLLPVALIWYFTIGAYLQRRKEAQKEAPKEAAYQRKVVVNQ